MATQLDKRKKEETQAKAAFQVEQRVKERLRAMRTMWIALAQDLYGFAKQEMWRDLGWRSFEQWLASPEVDISRRQAYYLLEIWRELVVKRQIKPAQLETCDMSKVMEVLPAIRRGAVELADAISDCETLGREDIRAKYHVSATSPVTGAIAGNDPLDATTEPEWAVCEACGSRYAVKRANDER